MKLVLVNGIIKGEGCTVGVLPEVRKEILSLESLRGLTFPVTLQHSYEVALLRVFFYQGKWHAATARKLDAFKSFWASSNSFGDSLSRALAPTATFESFCAGLNQELAYFILVPLREGQRLGTVLPAPESVLWLAATQNVVTGEMDVDPQEAPAPCLLLPKVTVQSAEELMDYYVRCDDHHLTGFMLVEQDKLRRFVGEDYLYRFKLRGNEPNIYKKYLELIKAGNESDVMCFYRQHEEALEEFDFEMKDLVDFIHSKYVERYVRKQYKLFPRLIHAILKQCHALYLEDRTERITRDRVADVILSFPPLFILNALAQHKQPHSETPDCAPPPPKKHQKHPAASAPFPDNSLVKGTN